MEPIWRYDLPKKLLLPIFFYFHYTGLLVYYKYNMKKRRIFIAINFPEQIKKKLLAFKEGWADLPVRWTRETNLHITLTFIGYVDDEQMLEVCQLAKEVASKHKSFEIKLKKIILGPPQKPPRMIWVEGESNQELSRLKDDLEKVLFNSNRVGFKSSGYSVFRPHITLARINQNQWRELSNKPEIDRDISLVASVETIEVMESHLSRGGGEYAVLESIELGG